MSKNLIPEICKMLGVELGEEFKWYSKHDCITYRLKFEKDSALYHTRRTYKDLEGKEKVECNWIDGKVVSEFLKEVLGGRSEIVKLPWKPKMGDTVYAFYSPAFAPFAHPRDKTNYKWSVDECIWNDTPAARALLKAGWAFKTKAEAIEALPAAARKEGAEYELPDTEEPWKPEHGRKYWSFIRYYYDDEEKLAVTSSYIWTGDVMGRALLKAGWVFRTKGEAEAALPKVAEELGVEYQL